MMMATEILAALLPFQQPYILEFCLSGFGEGN